MWTLAVLFVAHTYGRVEETAYKGRCRLRGKAGDAPRGDGDGFVNFLHEATLKGTSGAKH